MRVLSTDRSRIMSRADGLECHNDRCGSIFSPTNRLRHTCFCVLIATAIFLVLCAPLLGAALSDMEDAKTFLLLYNKGLESYRNGDMPAAIDAWSQSLAICKTLRGNERSEAACYQNIGGALVYMGKYEEAIAKQEQALAIYQKIKGTEWNQAGCYKNIGAALGEMAKYEEAIARQEQALGIFKTIKGTERNQAGCYKNIGVTLQNMGKYKEAIAEQEQALAIYKKIQSTEGDQATSYMNIGAALLCMGEYEEGIAKQEQAMAIYKKIKGTERNQASCYQNIGGALVCMGKYEEAIARQEQALGIFKTIKGTERNQAGCYVNIGVALQKMGKYKEAIAEQEQALAIYKKIQGTEGDQAGCYQNIGIVLEIMGKYEEGITKQEQALSIFKTIKGTKREREICYANIGWAHMRAGLYSRAIVSFNRAGRNWWTWRGLGNTYRFRGESGDDQNAVRLLQEAIELAEKVRTGVMAFEHRAGIFEEPAQVFPDFVILLVDLSENKAKVEHPEVLSWSVDPRSDTVLLEAAFHFADRGKGRAMEDALREKATLKATRPDTNLLVKDKELSLQISKLASVRQQLSEAELERRKRLTQQIDGLQQQRNMLEFELKRSALGGYVLPEFRKPAEMAKGLLSKTAVLQYSVGEKKSWLLILTREGITAHRVGAETPAFPELLPRQEATIGQLVQAWKERPEKIGLDGLVSLAHIRVEDLGRKPKERHNLIDASKERAILERLGEVTLPSSALSELRDKGIRHLLVIPDGSLHYVPFAILRVESGSGRASKEKHYLVEEFSISYTPAMTTLETIRKHKREREDKRKLQRRSLLAFANPDFREEILPSPDDMVTRVRSFRYGYYRDSGLRLTVLPETEQEAVRAGSLFAPVKIYRSPMVEVPEGHVVVCVSGAASEDQVKRLLGPSGKKGQKAQWRYLLFSTHGLADTRNGMLSCIALSSPFGDSTEDGFLQAQEVMDLELDADLVMLSACQTGLGKMRGGEGLVGLSSAFFYAGAESVCASLWQVPSGPTGQLVLEFFRQLREGVDRAEALRQAQLRVLRQGRGSDGRFKDYSDPYCWAAFVLTGEWM